MGAARGARDKYQACAYTACIAFIVYTAYIGIYAYMYCYIVRALTFWLNDL